ncbi:MAG TPA: SAM hydroxide adenosyltransferase [Candidatus Saccharimonadales bacterium]|jgi:hypothetical protein
MKTISGSIITDCGDTNARTRQELRFKSLFGVKPAFLGVQSYAPIEAAGNLIDQLDVLTNFPLADNAKENIVLVNVAPRGEDVQKKWDNGTPFCHFRFGRTLIVSTYEGHCLALARNFGITDKVELLDIPTVTDAAVERGTLTWQPASRICNTQFRSLEFLPLAAYWLWRGDPVPSQTQSLADLPSTKNQVWHIDDFGNAKTTLLAEDIAFKPGKQTTLANGQTAVCYDRLADVPQNVTALTIGSSGFGSHRFLEVVIGHRGRAADRHDLGIGSPVLDASRYDKITATRLES